MIPFDVLGASALFLGYGLGYTSRLGKAKGGSVPADPPKQFYCAQLS
jgi:hypothetical protein